MKEWLDRGRHRINERSCFGRDQPHPNGSVYAILMEVRLLFVLLHMGNINKTQRRGETFQQRTPWSLLGARCCVQQRVGDPAECGDNTGGAGLPGHI